MIREYSVLLGYFTVFLIATLFLFSEICTSPIRIWDEAIYANNALEMAINGDLLVLKNDGVATLYNTKPPFVIWLQSFCIKVFGANEFSVRLPSALAVLLTILSMFFFSYRVLRLPIVGMIAGLTLILSDGFFRDHVARTGDLDAVLAMFITFFSLSYITYLVSRKNKSNLIYITSLFVLLAFFTKSFAAFLPLPGLFIATLMSSERKILVDKHLYISIFVVALAIVGYYLIREYHGTGYIAKVFDSEPKRLFYNIMPWHSQPFDFYYSNWYKRNFFSPFIYLLPISAISLFIGVDDRVKKFVRYGFTWLISYLFILSIPTVKLDWYDATLYPMMSLLVGLGFYLIVNIAQKKAGSFFHKVVIAIIVCTYAVMIRADFRKLSITAPMHPQEKAGNFMRDLRKEKSKYDTYTVLYQSKWIEHLDQAKFYQKAYKLEYNYKINILQYLSDIKTGDTILTCQKSKIDSLDAYYQKDTLEESPDCLLLVIRESIKQR